MSLVLDSGALIALERNDQEMWHRWRAALLTGTPLLSHGGVIGQAWRGGGARRALMAKAINGLDVRPLDERLGRAAGELLARFGGSDVIDAALVLLAHDGDSIFTSDPHDLRPLAEIAGRHVEIVAV